MYKDDIILPPDPARVMEGLRDTGYEFNTAIADIIDNSIAANADRVDIRIGLDPNNDIYVYIADNGCGMNELELQNAMRYGSDERANKASLGKFGLGLKTASTAFCRSLSLVSKGNDLVCRKVQWDLDYIVSSHNWSLRQPEITDDEKEILEEISGDGTGTLVVWEKVDRLIPELQPAWKRKALSRIEDELRFHISLVYQRFLDKEDMRASNVSICLNGKDIEAWDPFCLSEENTTVAYEDCPYSITMPDGEEVTDLKIKAVILPRKDEFSTPEAANNAKIKNDLQGFYIYRENRLIHYGDWMRMYTNEPHGSLLRVELSFDHKLDEAFKVDIKKSRIMLNKDIYDDIKDSILVSPRRAADQRYRTGVKKKVEQESNTAHDASNRSIDEKAASVEESKVDVVNESTGEVNVTNNNGTFKHQIKIIHVDKPGQYRVVPVESIDNGLLWAPSIADGKHAVEINMSHPYYQRVYYPVLEQNVLVTGMDSLLWALAESELSTINNQTKEQFEEMRFLVSKCLRKLVADLPDPFNTEEEV